MRSDFWSGVVGAAGPAVRTLSYVKGSGPLSQRALPGSNMAEVHKFRAIGIIPTPKRLWTSGRVDRAVPARYSSLAIAMGTARSTPMIKV